MNISARSLVGVALALVVQMAGAQGLVREDTLSFSLVVYGEWTDNRDGVSGDLPENPVEDYDYSKQDGFKVGIGPGIVFFRQSGKTEWYVRYHPMYQWWDEVSVGQTQEELTHEASVELRFESGGRLDVSMDNRFKYIDDPDRYEGDEVDLPDIENRRFDTSSRHYDNRLGGDVRYALAPRWYSTLDSYWQIIRYDEEDMAEDSDEDKAGAEIGLTFQQTPLLGYGVQVAFDTYDRKTLDTQEDGGKVPMGYDSASIGVGGRYKLNKVTSFNANYGYQYVWHENEEIDDREYPTDAKFEMTLLPSERIQVLLGGTFGVTEGYVYPYVTQDKKAYYANLSYRHTPRLSSTYRLEYRNISFEERYADPETPDEDFYGEAASKPRGERDGVRDELFARVGVNFRWNDGLTLSGYYSFEDVDSEVSDPYSKNIVGIRANYRF